MVNNSNSKYVYNEEEKQYLVDRASTLLHEQACEVLEEWGYNAFCEFQTHLTPCAKALEHFDLDLFYDNYRKFEVMVGKKCLEQYSPGNLEQSLEQRIREIDKFLADFKRDGNSILMIRAKRLAQKQAR